MLIIFDVVEERDPLRVLRVGLLAGSGEVLALEADGADACLQIIVSSGRGNAAGAQVLVFGNDSEESITFEEFRAQCKNEMVFSFASINGALIDKVDVHLVDNALDAELASGLVFWVELNFVNLDLQLGR